MGCSQEPVSEQTKRRSPSPLIQAKCVSKIQGLKVNDPDPRRTRFLLLQVIEKGIYIFAHVDILLFVVSYFQDFL
jgi:hypothetical protein